MPRQPRVFHKQGVYEIVSRARETLPLPQTNTTNEILKGIYGRTLRYGDVTLCNFVEMANHNHQHTIPNRPGALPKFYREFKKDVTESVKALLGKEQLNLWEPRSTAAIMPLLEDIIARLVYMFCNPAKAGLVDSIDDYPGLSSWHAFKRCAPLVEATVTIPVRYFHKAAIPRLPEGDVLLEEDDSQIVTSLYASDDYFDEVLVIKPFAWLKGFGITTPKKIAAVRTRIIKMVTDRKIN